MFRKYFSQLKMSMTMLAYDCDFYTTIKEAVDDIFIRIADKIKNEEYAIWGHSMGSLLSYELYYKIKESNIKLPKHMFFLGSELQKYQLF